MTSTLFTLALLLPAAPVPEAKDTRPKGPPPRIVAVSIDSEGGFQFLESQTQVVPRQVHVQVLVGGPVVSQTRTVMESVPVMRVRKVDGESVQVYGVDGKKIDREDVRKLAKRTMPALVSSDGKLVDPFYLRLAREGTLVLVLPAKEAGPAPAPVGEKIKLIPKRKD